MSQPFFCKAGQALCFLRLVPLCLSVLVRLEIDVARAPCLKKKNRSRVKHGNGAAAGGGWVFSGWSDAGLEQAETPHGKIKFYISLIFPPTLNTLQHQFHTKRFWSGVFILQVKTMFLSLFLVHSSPADWSVFPCLRDWLAGLMSDLHRDVFSTLLSAGDKHDRCHAITETFHTGSEVEGMTSV